jgi:hypothetical protein
MRIHRRQLLCRCHTCFPLLRSRAKPEQSCCSFRAISSIFADGFAEQADVKPGTRYSQLPIHHLRVRILPPQPTSPAPRDFTLDNARKARQWRAFANSTPVSRLRLWAASSPHYDCQSRQSKLAICPSCPDSSLACLSRIETFNQVANTTESNSVLMSKEEMGQPCSPPGNRPKEISNRCAGKFSVARLGDRNQEWEIHLKPSDISGTADAPTIRGGPRKGPATTGAAWLTKKRMVSLAPALLVLY